MRFLMKISDLPKLTKKKFGGSPFREATRLRLSHTIDTLIQDLYDRWRHRTENKLPPHT